MPDEDEVFRFSDVQNSVLADTFATLGIDPANQEAFQPNEPFVMNVAQWFGTPPEGRGGMLPPSVEGVFVPGMEPSMMATMDRLGEEFGDNPEVSEWLQQQRQLLAKGYGDPLHKNRVVNLFDQSFFGGRARRKQADAPPQLQAPTPVPTPPQPNTPEWEIWQEEERRRKLQGGTQ